jgi:hypothetical protein
MPWFLAVAVLGFQADKPVTIVSEKPRFTIEMPGPTERTKEPTKEPADQAVDDEWTCEFKGAIFHVVTKKSPIEVTKNQLKIFFDAMQEQLAREVKGKFVEGGNIERDNAPGRDITIEIPGGELPDPMTLRAKMFLLDGYIVSLTVIGGADDFPKVASARFFNTFQPAAGAVAASLRKVSQATPDEAIKTLITADMFKDEAAARAVFLPAQDLEVFWQGERRDSNLAASLYRITIKKPTRILKAGDTVSLKGYAMYTVTEKDLGADYTLITHPRWPVLIKAYLVDGKWKIQPDPIIAYQKEMNISAEELRRRLRK